MTATKGQTGIKRDREPATRSSGLGAAQQRSGLHQGPRPKAQGPRAGRLACALYSGALMRLASSSLTAVTAWSGTVGLVVVLTLAISRTPLGSPLFFSALAVFTGAYAVQLARVWSLTGDHHRAFRLALVFAVLLRLPLAISPVGADSDMVRYLWDGRVQQQGIQPVRGRAVRPRAGRTHSAESARMPSLRARTPYPPGAQLFFRLVVAVRDSTLAMKLALVACDLLTILVVCAVAAPLRPFRVAGAGLCVEPAGRARGRAQRTHRRARRACGSPRRPAG